MSAKNNGFALILILTLISFVVLLIFGLSSLVLSTQSSTSRKNDMELATLYANQAIFDNSNGAVAQILAFDRTLGFESASIASRNALRSTYFTNSCSGGPVSPAGYSKGLCSSESAASGFSTPLLRVATTVLAPCNTYNVKSITAASTQLPLLDDNSSSNSFTYSSGQSGLCHQPNYMIELLSTNLNIPGLVSSARLYRVTSRGFGRNGDTKVTEQAYFYVRCPNNQCRISLLNSQIIR